MKETKHVWEAAGIKIETDKVSASLVRPREKSIPDFSHTAQRRLRLGGSALKAPAVEGTVEARPEGRTGTDWPPHKLSLSSRVAKREAGRTNEVRLAGSDRVATRLVPAADVFYD